MQVLHAQHTHPVLLQSSNARPNNWTEYGLQAACRADLFSDKVSPENSSVPVSQEGQMSALRHALRSADEDEREQRYQALLSAESLDNISSDE